VLWVVFTIAAALAAGVTTERRYGARASALARTMLKVLLYGFTPPVAFLNIVGLEITSDVGGGILIGWAALIAAGVLAWAFGRHVLGLEPPSNGVLVNIDPTNGGYQSQTSAGAGVSLSPVAANHTI